MEGKSIYEDSKDEILRVLKSIGNDSITINIDKLDGNTKEELLIVIKDVLYKRSREIDKVILGVQ